MVNACFSSDSFPAWLDHFPFLLASYEVTQSFTPLPVFAIILFVKILLFKFIFSVCVSICVCAKCVGAGNQTLVLAKIENVLNH